MSTVLELRNSAENAIRGSARKGSDGTCGENVKNVEHAKIYRDDAKSRGSHTKLVPNTCGRENSV
jgi:hypothetical protein